MLEPNFEKADGLGIRSTEKKFRCAGPEIFLRFKTDLNFSRP